MYERAKGLLFHLDPERAHHLGLWYLKRIHRSPRRQAGWMAKREPASDRLRVRGFGLAFDAPLGMAAGFDKGAECYNALLALGFGHVEVGTLTPRPQAGNPRPRIERHPAHHALVNRLGFNNPGVAVAAQRLAERVPAGVVGVNVGRNKDTPEERALDDYVAAAQALAPHGSYVTVNISSPNTPGLRNLQEPASVARLVGRVLEGLDDADAPRPVLLKLHPDAPSDEVVGVAKAALDAGAAGIVAVNTTTERPPGLEGAGPGGLSGEPLRERANAQLAALHRGLGGEATLVGVGGLSTGRDAIERVRAGACVLQAYTGFIYRGPRFAELVHREMVEELDRLGVDRLEELVGRG